MGDVEVVHELIVKISVQTCSNPQWKWVNLNVTTCTHMCTLCYNRYLFISPPQAFQTTSDWGKRARKLRVPFQPCAPFCRKV